MKKLFASLMLVTAAPAAQPILPPVTPEALARLQQMNPMDRLARPDAPAADRQPSGKPSIISQSTILSDGTNWTLVPNGAVLHLPASLKARIAARPEGRLLPWIEFLTLNRGWITTSEVTFAQATGENPLPAERAAFWTRQDKIVVAVHQSGPISVRTPESSTQTASTR